MQLNPSPRTRKIIYIANALALPVVFYLRAHDVIGDLEVSLYFAEQVAVFAMAGLNVDTKK